MSSTFNVEIEMHDKQALEKACERLGIKIQEGSHKLYAGTEKGTGVFLPEWRYPVVIKESGTIAYDNYNGSWGKIEELNKLKAFYGAEKAKIEARKKGYTCFEKWNEQTKEIEVRIQI